MPIDLHSGLKNQVLADFKHAGARFAVVRLQHGKNHFVEALHVQPTTWTTSGLQSTDLLSFLNFHRGPCPFLNSECYSRQVPMDFDARGFAEAFDGAYADLTEAAKQLESCGVLLDRPEGTGFFFGRSSEARRFKTDSKRGDGHTGAKSERMKQSEDQYFRFVFTWLERPDFKGWVTHYRPQHFPLSAEFDAALKFLGGFHEFNECPEFEFESCRWRAFPYAAYEMTFFDGSAETAHRYFDSHKSHFSPGIERLLAAHAKLSHFGISFLDVKASAPERERPAVQQAPPTAVRQATRQPVTQDRAFRYDVAMSFAGSERPKAEALAKYLRDAGLEVFYDNFYPEQLWGKDLAALFDRIYRKESRFCLMFVSAEYATRIWTTHERRSALARMVQEKGDEYILPIKVDDTDLDGLPPTIGYLSLANYSMDQIGTLLLKKLRGQV